MLLFTTVTLKALTPLRFESIVNWSPENWMSVVYVQLIDYF